MFCPSCKVEYRQGFTRCSDCDVELVAALDESSNSPDGAVTAENPLLRILESADKGLRDLTCNILDQADVPYQAPEADAPLLFSSLRTPSYSVWVRKSDLDAANQALQDAVGRSAIPQSGLALDAAKQARQDFVAQLSNHRLVLLADALGLTQPEQEPDGDEGESEAETPYQPVRWTDFMGAATEDKGPEAIPEGWDPDTADIEVWSGFDPDMEKTLVLSLRENGIPSRIAGVDGMKRNLFVRHEDEDRAREILREIAEASPPK